VTKLYKYLFVGLVFWTIAPVVASAGTKHNSYTPVAIQAALAVNPSASYKRRKARLPKIRLAQNSGQRISPSAALRAAQRVAPGSRGLGVRYVQGRKGYIVKLKTRGGVLRVFVDARTGRVRR